VKRLDRFLVTEIFLEKGLRFISKLEGGSSDHRPISMRWIPSLATPPPPPCASLKIYKVWSDDPDFQKLVFSSWKKLQVDINEPLMIQFNKNLNNTKASINKWIPIWKSKKKKEISEIENDLSKIGTRLDRAPLSTTLLEEIRSLEIK
jgi:hypothetical protein